MHKFLHVSKPFQANWGWRGQEGVCLPLFCCHFLEVDVHPVLLLYSWLSGSVQAWPTSLTHWSSIGHTHWADFGRYCPEPLNSPCANWYRSFWVVIYALRVQFMLLAKAKLALALARIVNYEFYSTGHSHYDHKLYSCQVKVQAAGLVFNSRSGHLYEHAVQCSTKYSLA